MEIGPLEELVRSRLDEEKIRQSPKEFGIVTVEIPSLKASEMAKEDIPQGQMADYLLASAACYPAFKRRSHRQQELCGRRLPGQPAHRPCHRAGRQ